jgi:hypothetical protein
MAKGPRIARGLPRGGVGYGCIPVAIGALLVGCLGRGPVAVVVRCLALPLCIWLGLGLHRDDRFGEAIDILVMDSDDKGFWGTGSSGELWRLSSLSILACAVSIVIAALRE